MLVFIEEFEIKMKKKKKWTERQRNELFFLLSSRKLFYVRQFHIIHRVFIQYVLYASECVCVCSLIVMCIRADSES